MPTNTKLYMGSYMNKYVANSKDIHCDICGGKYKTYSKYRHIKTKKHIQAINNCCTSRYSDSDVINKCKTFLYESKIRNLLRELIFNEIITDLNDYFAHEESECGTDSTLDPEDAYVTEQEHEEIKNTPVDLTPVFSNTLNQDLDN